LIKFRFNQELVNHMQLSFIDGCPFLLSTHTGYPQTPLLLILGLYTGVVGVAHATGRMLEEMLLFPTKPKARWVIQVGANWVVLALRQGWARNRSL
jgi:hypothetical protein